MRLRTERAVLRLAVLGLMIAPMALVGAHRALAADGGPVAVEVGVGFLGGGDSGTGLSKTGLHAGLGFRLPEAGLLTKRSRPSIDFGFNYNRGTGGDDYLESWSAMYAERVRLGPGGVAGGSFPYVGVGLGIVDAHASISGGRSGGYDSNEHVQAGGKLLAGVGFGRTYLELSYQDTGSTLGIRSDSLNLSVGTHI
jgi:hypothetical protein